MKKILWDYIGAESTIPVKALASTAGEEHSTRLASYEQCTAKSGHLFDDAAFITASAVDSNIILFFVFFLVPWMLFPAIHQKEEYNSSFTVQLPLTVPLYLRHRRLVYYS